MQIENGSVVGIDYSLQLEGGQVVAASAPGEPFEYVHGSGQLVPGLEKALAGMRVGDSKQVTLPPEEGYGAYDESAVKWISRDGFVLDLELKPGMHFAMRGPKGEDVPFVIREVGEERVLADFNHPLANKTLRFDVTVRAVRPGSNEDMEQATRSPRPRSNADIDPFDSCRMQ